MPLVAVPKYTAVRVTVIQFNGIGLVGLAVTDEREKAKLIVRKKMMLMSWMHFI